MAALFLCARATFLLDMPSLTHFINVSQMKNTAGNKTKSVPSPTRDETAQRHGHLNNETKPTPNLIISFYVDLTRTAEMFNQNNQFCVFLIALITILASATFATTVTWNGSADNNWNNPANWSTGAVPDGDDDVIIPAGTPDCKIIKDVVNVNTLTNDGTIEATGFAIVWTRTLTNNGTFKKTPFTEDASFEIKGKLISVGPNVFSELTLVNNGNIETDELIIKGVGGSVFENHGKIDISNLGIRVNQFQNTDTIKAWRDIDIHVDSTASNSGQIKTEDATGVESHGGDIKIRGAKCIMTNEGEIVTGKGGFHGRGGNIHIFAKNCSNTGKMQCGDGGMGGVGGAFKGNFSSYLSNTSGGQLKGGLPGDDGRYFEDHLEGEVHIYADSIYMTGSTSKIYSYYSLSINARRMFFSDLGGQKIDGGDVVEFHTPKEGIIDFLGCHTYATVFADSIAFTCDSILAPPDSFHIFYMWADTIVYNPSDTSILGGSFDGDYYEHVFNVMTDAFQAVMQNQSMAPKVLNYSISSLLGWVAPISGSSSILNPFKMDTVDIEYTVPLGLLEETTDTVTMILTISGTTFADTAFAYITSDSGMVLGIQEKASDLPSAFAISAYPNPFNSAVNIAAPASAEIEIFDLNGCRITPPAPLDSGEHGKSPLLKGDIGGLFLWHPEASLSSGVYLVRATVDGESVSKRIVYLK